MKNTANRFGGFTLFLFIPVFFIASLLSCSSHEQPKEQPPVPKKVAEEPQPFMPVLPDSVLATKKTVYLTCDDGPNFGSNIVMNIAQEEHIPVNFFEVGVQYTGIKAKIFASAWKRMHTQPGVEVYNHSFTHALNEHYEYYYAHPDTVVYDFKRAADSGHFTTPICRTPGNNFWRTSTVTNNSFKRYIPAAEAMVKAGFIIIGWECEWYNHKMVLKQTPEQMANEIDYMLTNNHTFTPHHIVLLTHDQSFADPGDSARLHQFVKLLKSWPDYRFENISRYPGILKKRAETGEGNKIKATSR
jgi:peptidoglycan/xylan/chitin deacetylase (PgdA/CDA1 family)